MSGSFSTLQIAKGNPFLRESTIFEELEKGCTWICPDDQTSYSFTYSILDFSTIVIERIQIHEIEMEKQVTDFHIIWIYTESNELMFTNLLGQMKPK